MKHGVIVLLALGLGFTGMAADQREGGRGRGAAAPAVSIFEDGDFTIRPPWSNAPELIYDISVPHGTVHRFIMKSQDSKIYKGISRDQPGAVVPYERPVAVYIPAQYVPGTPAPFIVVQDGYT